MPSATASAARSDRDEAGSPPIEPRPSRILVRDVNWLGDVVMSLPALRAIRRAWPEAHLAVLIKRELASFFDGAGWIDAVIPYSIGRGMRGVGDRRRAIGEIRARQFDLAIIFPSSFESALWIRVAGVPRRAGFSADARGAMLTHRAAPARDAVAGPQPNWWLAMVRQTLGVDGDAGDFAIQPAARNLATVRTWLGPRRKRPDAPLVAIAPAAAFGPAKEWPLDRFAQLIDQLSERDGVECVLVGAPGERAKCDLVAAKTRAGALVAAGETNVGELIALLAIADGFAGNDSGAMHLAGALGRPTVAIFGSTNPLRTAPFGARSKVIWHRLACSPCLARTCKFGHYNCLREVSPDEVGAALREMMAAAGDRGQ
ncbi:MAG TPA: lipopolysaccharide heptosyltransferase II [Candidatus Binataceae bacterium]|nr:lipopolysaccharide heptosyltransferase II [Candidatus Binataceae bacterium]